MKKQLLEAFNEMPDSQKSLILSDLIFNYDTSGGIYSSFIRDTSSKGRDDEFFVAYTKDIFGNSNFAEVAAKDALSRL